MDYQLLVTNTSHFLFIVQVKTQRQTDIEWETKLLIEAFQPDSHVKNKGFKAKCEQKLASLQIWIWRYW